MEQLSAGAKRVLEAAQSLFAEQGFDAVSISNIADRAGVSKANIYHHFSSKTELYYAVLKSACSASAELLSELDEQEESFESRLRQFARCHLKNLLENQDASNLVIREFLDEFANIKNEIFKGEFNEQDFDSNFGKLLDIIRAGQASGDLRQDINGAVMASLIISSNIMFLKSRDVLSRLPTSDFIVDPEQHSQTMIDILLHGALQQKSDSV